MAKKKQPIDAIELLHEYGFKHTPLRAFILETLSQSSVPLTVATLKRKARKLGGDPATIYRALNAFVEVGLVRELSVEKTKALYEFGHTEEHSHHIICTECHTVETIPFCVRNIQANAVLKSKLFRIISEHTLSFNGTCRKCVRAVR